MIISIDHPDVAQFNARSKENLADILAHWKSCGAEIEVPSEVNLFSIPAIAESRSADVFYVCEGQLSYIREEKPVLHYDEGSLVGLIGEREREEIQVMRTYDDQRTVVVPYSTADLQNVLMENPSIAVLWQQYNQSLLRIMVSVAEHHMSFLPRIAPEITHFDKGQIIMREGESSSRAFYLLSGKATVFAGDTTVGEVESGQLLGHLGLFKDGPRTATVTADTSCDAIALGEQQLLALLQVRPDLCREVLGQLAGTVGQLNSVVSNLA